ncbi:MAG: DUF354 domain-containing protein [Candidatus Altiarchaeota archaeon]
MSSVWLDIMTTKQVWFLGTLAEYLNDKGIETWVTIRHYQENTEVLDRAIESGRFSFSYDKSGVHGGQSLKGKWESYIKRCDYLAKGLKERDIGCAFSLTSPEMARVAYGFQVPHVTTSDTPFADAVNRLTLPMCQKLVLSWLFKPEEFTKYAIAEEDLVYFKGIDEIAWTKDYEPDPKVLDEIGLNPDKPIVVVRALSPHFAVFAHLFDEFETGIEGIIKELLEKTSADTQIVAIPRYGEQGPILRKEFGDKIKVVDHTEGPSLTSQADVLIAAGGTMNREAALLGTFAITMDPMAYDLVGEKWLAKKGLLMPTHDPTEAAAKAIELIENEDLRKQVKKKAAKVRKQLEDPTPVFYKEIKKFLEQ